MLFSFLLASSLSLHHAIMLPSEFHPTKLFAYDSTRPPTIRKRAVSDGIWIYGSSGPRVFSAFFHENVSHSVAVRLGKVGPVLPAQEFWAPAGAWAVVWEDCSDPRGSKAYYKLGAKRDARNEQIENDLQNFLSQLSNANSEANTRYINRSSAEGGNWVHGRIGHDVFSAYWHPSQRHTAAVIGKHGVSPSKETWAPAGEWAFAHAHVEPRETGEAMYGVDPRDSNAQPQYDVGRMYSETDFVVNRFLQALEQQEAGRELQNRNVSRDLVDGGVWLRGTAGNIVFSAYYHKKKQHQVAVQGGYKRQTYPLSRKQWVAPGQWAVVYAPIIDAAGVKAKCATKGHTEFVREYKLE